MTEMPTTLPRPHGSTHCCCPPTVGLHRTRMPSWGQEDICMVPGLPGWMSTLGSLAWSSLLSLPLSLFPVGLAQGRILVPLLEAGLSELVG